jgi:hypothetical protein
MRTRAFSVRGHDAELELWDSTARAAGYRQRAAWARAVLNAAAAGRSADAARSRRTDADSVDGELRGQLARVGNNLNQLVRLGHSSGVDATLAGVLVDAAARTRSVLAEVQRRLASR